MTDPSKIRSEQILFTWYDTKSSRDPDTQFYVMVNDYDREIRKTVISAFENYDIQSIPWSKREKFSSTLSL